MRETNVEGVALIKRWEGCRLEAYRDAVGVLTIGYGHTGDVKPGDKITQHEAEAILTVDLQRFEMAVNHLAPLAKPNRFAAMVALAFNVGVDAFERSTLLKKHNEGDQLSARGQAPLAAQAHKAAAGEFAKWCHAGGHVLAGLVKRRAAEAALYEKPEP